MALSAKQKSFINEYLTDFNATRAAQRAGYGGDDNSLAVIGSNLLRNAKVDEAIRTRLSEQAMKAEEVLRRLGEHARGNMNDFVRFDDNGNPSFDLQAASQYGKLQIAKKLKIKTRSWSEQFYNTQTDDFDSRPVVETTTEFELYDAQAALVQIGKHHKLFTDMSEVKTEVTENLDSASERLTSRIDSLAARIGAVEDAGGAGTE